MHGYEIEYVFGIPLMQDKRSRTNEHGDPLYSPEDVVLAERMVQYWTNFAKEIQSKTDYGKLTDDVAEWLRRWTANPMCSAREGSNPFVIGLFSFLIIPGCDFPPFSTNLQYGNPQGNGQGQKTLPRWPEFDEEFQTYLKLS